MPEGDDEAKKGTNVNWALEPETAAYLDDLVKTGLYGKSRTAVARRLVELGIDQMIDKGRIKQRTF